MNEKEYKKVLERLDNIEYFMHTSSDMFDLQDGINTQLVNALKAVQNVLQTLIEEVRAKDDNDN